MTQCTTAVTMMYPLTSEAGKLKSPEEIAQEIESIDSDTDSVTTYKHPYANDSDYCSLTKKSHW